MISMLTQLTGQRSFYNIVQPVKILFLRSTMSFGILELQCVFQTTKVTSQMAFSLSQILSWWNWKLFRVGRSRKSLMEYVWLCWKHVWHHFAFCKKYSNDAVILNPKSWTIQPDPNQPLQHAINILIHPNNNLPMTVCHQSKSLNKLALHFSTSMLLLHMHQTSICQNHTKNFFDGIFA